MRRITHPALKWCNGQRGSKVLVVFMLKIGKVGLINGWLVTCMLDSMKIIFSAERSMLHKKCLRRSLRKV